jgi:hypothetical protein
MKTKLKVSPLRVATSGIRLLPDFIIIGAQKCGTTSLYEYLAAHPAVAPAARKEVHYFDRGFRRGRAWYRAHFPTVPYRIVCEALTRQRLVVGEASPMYLFHPQVPRRVRALLPDVKLIALLRDPVERAYSQYHHRARRGKEPLPFSDAVVREADRIAGGLVGLRREETYPSRIHRHVSYLARGIYADQLARWLRVFPREQLLILTSEEFFSDTPRVFSQVLEFLGLPPWAPAQFNAFNPGTYSDMEPSMRRWLVEYFAPHNERLYQLIGRDLGWSR